MKKQKRNLNTRHCAICRRRIYFWNNFYRKYGFARVFNKKTLDNEGTRYFCSMECYTKTLDIKQKKNKNFFKDYYRDNGNWFKLGENKK